MAAAAPSDDSVSLAASRHEANGDPDFMASLSRGLSVIRAFSEHRRRLTISQISQKTGFSRASVRRCLYTLQTLGYVGEEDKLFFLRPQILSLGHAYLASTPLAGRAQPYLDAVAAAAHESCSAAILDGNEIVYVCRSAVTRIMSINLLLGSRLPAYCTSMGRVLLANLPDDEREAYLAQLKPVALTPETCVAIPALREVLKQVRADGYAIVDQELEVGLRSIAVPVRDTRGRVVAAMNVGAQAGRVTLAQMKTLYLPHLCRAAEQLGQLLLG